MPHRYSPMEEKAEHEDAQLVIVFVDSLVN